MITDDVRRTAEQYLKSNKISVLGLGFPYRNGSKWQIQFTTFSGSYVLEIDDRTGEIKPSEDASELIRKINF